VLFRSAAKGCHHHDSLASRQGGSPGAYGLKLKDAFTFSLGLGEAKSAKKEFSSNKMSKFNKVKATEVKDVEEMRKSFESKEHHGEVTSSVSSKKTRDTSIGR
jgi:hypothetical protein